MSIFALFLISSLLDRAYVEDVYNYDSGLAKQKCKGETEMIDMTFANMATENAKRVRKNARNKEITELIVDTVGVLGIFASIFSLYFLGCLF